MKFFNIEMSRSLSDQSADNYGNFMFDGDLSVDDRLSIELDLDMIMKK